MYACLVVQDVTGSKHHSTFVNILLLANILIGEIWFVAFVACTSEECRTALLG